MAEQVDIHERLRIAAEWGNRLAMQVWKDLQTSAALEQTEERWRVLLIADRTRLFAEQREVCEVLDILEEEE